MRAENRMVAADNCEPDSRLSDSDKGGYVYG